MAVAHPEEDKKLYPLDTLYRDLPYSIRNTLEQKLGVKSPTGNDYRTFGDNVGMKDHEIKLITEEALTRGEKVMERWKQTKGKKATIGNLFALLKELDLAEVRDYLQSHMAAA